jgi:hypothetical protein
MEKKTKGYRYGGRKKGTPNKATKMTRDLINNLLCEEYDRFQKELAGLKPNEFCKLYVDLIRYVTPTLKSVDINESNAHDSSLTERLKRMAEDSGKTS